jgi:hypothetical protein
MALRGTALGLVIIDGKFSQKKKKKKMVYNSVWWVRESQDRKGWSWTALGRMKLK